VPVAVIAMLIHATRQVDTTVSVSVVGSGDPDVVDFGAVADFAIAIAAAGDRGTATFTLTPEDDDVPENDERLTVSGVSDVSVAAATMLLTDDDEPAKLSVAGSAAAEDAVGERRSSRNCSSPSWTSSSTTATRTVSDASPGEKDRVPEAGA